MKNTSNPRKRAPGAGRPPMHGTPMRIYRVRLTLEHAEALRRAGAGNLSAGVRRLVERNRRKGEGHE